MNQWGWLNSTANSFWQSGITMTSGTSIPVYPQWSNPRPLAPVMESPSVRLGDREWLDAQISEVCALAEAA